MLDNWNCLVSDQFAHSHSHVQLMTGQCDGHTIKKETQKINGTNIYGHLKDTSYSNYWF